MSNERSVPIFIFMASLLAAGPGVSQLWGVSNAPVKGVPLARKSADVSNTVPRSAEGAELASEVYNRLAKSYFNLFSTDVMGFDATFSMEKDGKRLGTMHATWNRGDKKVSAKLQGSTEQSIKEAAESLVGDHVLSLLMWGPFKAALSAGSGVYAARSGAQYVIDASEKSTRNRPDLRSHSLSVSTDLRRLRNVLREKSGKVLDMVYQGEAADGKYFVSSTVTTGNVPGETPWTVEVMWTYTHKEGTVFVKKAVIKRTRGSDKNLWAAVLQTVSFRRGEAGIKKGKNATGEAGETTKDVQEDITEDLRGRFWEGI